MTLTKENCVLLGWTPVIDCISSSNQSNVEESIRAKYRYTSSYLSRSPCIKSIKAPFSSCWSKWGGGAILCGNTPLYVYTLATLKFLRRWDTSRLRPMEECLSRTRTFVFLKRAPFTIITECAIEQGAPSAGFMTRYTGHVPRGLHKKGPPLK